MGPMTSPDRPIYASCCISLLFLPKIDAGPQKRYFSKMLLFNRSAHSAGPNLEAWWIAGLEGKSDWRERKDKKDL